MFFFVKIVAYTNSTKQPSRAFSSRSRLATAFDELVMSKAAARWICQARRMTGAPGAYTLFVTQGCLHTAGNGGAYKALGHGAARAYAAVVHWAGLPLRSFNARRISARERERLFTLLLPGRR